MRQHAIVFTAVVLSVSLVGRSSPASLVIQHSGSNNPTTEGWTALPGAGGGVAVGAINDGGTAAWFVDDNSTALNTIFFYEHISSAAEIVQGNTFGWTLSTTLRVASDEALAFDGSPFVSYRDGVNGWQMNFGLNGSGDTIVRLFDGGAGITHTLAGNATYNTFSLQYDPIAATADLFVNGAEVISNYGGFATTQTRVIWGAGRSPDQGQGNFSDVSLATVPEPSSGALLSLFGMSVIGTARCRRSISSQHAE